MAVNFENTTDPRKLAANQRGLIWYKGDVLNQQDLDRAGQAEGNSNAYLGSINDLENRYMLGEGGYTPEEAAGVRGNPNNWQQYYNPLGEEQQRSEATQRAAAGSPTLNVNPDTVQQEAELLNIGTGALNEQLDTMGGNVRGAIDPERLRQSGDANIAQQQSETANRAQQFLPEDQEALVTGAGISAGLKDQQAVGDLERAARAAGSGPEGVAAYRSRMARAQAIDAGNAMTQARAEAAKLRMAGAGTAEQQRMEGATTAEQQRLAAEKGATDTEVGAEQSLGQYAINKRAEDMAGRMGVVQGDEARRLAAAQDAAKLKVGTESGIVGQRQGTAGMGVSASQNADTSGSNREAEIARTRMNQQNVGLAGQKQTQQQQNQNAENARQRQQQTYATQVGGSTQATNLGIAASQTPSGFDKAIGTAAGVAGAVAPFIADGDVVTEPQLRVLGEDGPEAVVPYRSKFKTAMGGVGAGLTSLSNSLLQKPNGQDPFSKAAGMGAGMFNAYRSRRMPQDDSQAMPGQTAKVVTKPTLAMMGDEEPEMAVPLGYRCHAKARPIMMFQ